MSFLFKRMSLSKRIAGGFFVLILLILSTGIFSVLSLQNNRKIDQYITSTYIPLINETKDLSRYISESRKLVKSWIFSPDDLEKKELKFIVENQITAGKQNIATIIQEKEFNDSLKVVLHLLLTHLDSLSASQNLIMNTLSDNEAYANYEKLDKAINEYYNKLVPMVNTISEKINNFINAEKKGLAELLENKANSYQLLTFMMVVTMLLILGVSVTASYLSENSIVKPVETINNYIKSLALGEVPKIDRRLTRKTDEIGDMSKSLEMLVKGIEQKIQFAESIGQANYEAPFQMLSEDDKLGKSLIVMRDNLKKNTEETNRRNWVTQGMVSLGEILRKTDVKFNDLFDEALRFIIKYTRSNQGGIFMLKQESTDQYLEMIACYAYERKKYLEKKVEVGEGLLGQCVLEKDKIFVTRLPDQYTHITSGLGFSTPKCLLILPLLINEKVYGVLEIASFEVYQDHELELLGKMSDSLASVLSAAQMNENTKKLLEESQMQKEQMNAQEEEMRQNMEELMATQEEMNRKSEEMKGFMEAIEQSNICIASINTSGKIISVNRSFLSTFQYNESEILGKHIDTLHVGKINESEEYLNIWGNIQSATDHRGEYLRKNSKGNVLRFEGNYKVEKDAGGNVLKIWWIGINVSDYKSSVQQEL